MIDELPIVEQRRPDQRHPFVCFDVFDTLLTRIVGQPDDVFLLLGRRLLREGEITCSAEVFARQRMHAEERANAIRGWHPTLEDIHRETARALGLPTRSISRLVRAELDLERDLSRKLPAADALVEQARRLGAAVVFVTDTNMPSGFIRELLASKGLCRPEDRIFASCECKVDKARGFLFPHVSRTLGVNPRMMLHHGNDAVADLRNGRLSGWTVRHVPEANLNRYERALGSQAFATGGLSSLLAGASRLARLGAPVEEPATIHTVTAGVMAPLLVAWMIWTMRQAVRDGCRRLYFLSRDGQVLLDVARRLEPVLHTGLDLRYLHGSRQATQLAGSPEAAFRDLLRQLCRLKDVAEFLSVQPDDLTQFLPERLRDRTSWERPLSAADRQDILALLDTEHFRSLVDARSADVRTMVFDFLRQEGWADGIPFALVDVGWRASMAGALSTLLAGSSLESPSRYYFFGLGDDAHRVAGAENVQKLDAWFFDDASGHGYLPYLVSTTSLLEMFCAGDHGAVIGYRREGYRINPVLRTPTSPMQDWGLPLMRRTTSAFVETFAATLQARPELVDLDADVRRAIQKVMDLFWLHPTPAEMRAWGSFPVEVGLTNSVVLPLAEKVGFRQFVRALRARTLAFRSIHSWPRGTAMMSGWPYRALLTGGWRLRQEMPRLRRRLRWLQARFPTPWTRFPTRIT